MPRANCFLYKRLLFDRFELGNCCLKQIQDILYTDLGTDLTTQGDYDRTADCAHIYILSADLPADNPFKQYRPIFCRPNMDLNGYAL